MRIRLLYLAALAGLNVLPLWAQSNTWTWVSGTSATTLVPDFGTRGQYAPTNQPPGLRDAASWIGPDGRLYLFGGQAGSGVSYNTIWVYDRTIDRWMWKRGSNAANAARVIGTPGFPSETNDPGARTGFAWSATPSGDLWIYGGDAPDGTAYADLWHYDFALDRWIYLDVHSNGSKGTSMNVDADYSGGFGGIGHPGSRSYAQMHFDEDSGKAWLFMGLSFSGSSPAGMGDVWELSPADTTARWVGGPSNPDDAGSYPAQYAVESSSFYPPSRNRHSLWRSTNGKFYIFGGATSWGSRLCDFWSWNPASGEWAWVAGSWFENYHPVYRAFGVTDTLPGTSSTYVYENTPGGRHSAATWTTSDGKFVIRGGFGYTDAGTSTALNDVFVFDPIARTMLWSEGDTIPSTEDQRPVFGTRGVASDSTDPGARYASAVAVDGEGRPWIFGGMALANTSGTFTYRNHLFMLYEPVPGVFAGGSGTISDPYQVATLTQLQSMRDHVDQHFILLNDIDASATATWNYVSGVYRGFDPIGTNTNPFTGSLDGNGRTIAGLTIHRGTSNAVGLFGRLNGSVAHLRLTDVDIVGDQFVGGLTGRNVGSIEDCSVRGTVVGSGSAVGGLAGDLFSGWIDRSFADVQVSGGTFAGNGTGGLAGTSSSGSLISDCFATGTVLGDDRVGGLVGNNDGTVVRSYSAGAVTGDLDVGGLVGRNTGTVATSYWNTSTAGPSSSAGGTGRTDAQMRQASSFTGFNFDDRWFLWEGLSYPAFRDHLTSPPPGLSGTGRVVTANDSVFSFDSTRISLAFTGLGIDSILFAYVEYDPTEAASISFTGPAPLFTSNYRWIVAHAGNSFTSAALTISNISTLPGAADAGTVKLYHRPTVGSGSFTLITTSAAGDSISATVLGFGEYILASDIGALSVMLDAFTAVVERQRTELHWQTRTEVDNAGWIVERRHPGAPSPAPAVDPEGWESVGFVPGGGTTSAGRAYRYSDTPRMAFYPTPSTRIAYRLKQMDRTGTYSYSRVLEVDLGSAPRTFALSRNYPNPFNPTTTLEYTLETDGPVELRVYDALGRLVATLVDETQSAGIHYQATFDATTFPSGTYIARLTSGGKSSVSKLLLLK